MHEEHHPHEEGEPYEEVHHEEHRPSCHRHHRPHHWGHHRHLGYMPMRGALHLLILKMLEEKPLYGSEIREALKSRLDLDVPSSAIYAVLGILEEKGLVLSSWETGERGAARKVYRITEEGISYLRERVEELRRSKKIFDYLLS